MSDWIDVKEKLPPIRRAVLLVFFAELNGKTIPSVAVGQYHNPDWWYVDPVTESYNKVRFPVSYWSEIQNPPPPPKTELRMVA